MPASQDKLEHRVALVTGGNTGIGRAVALAYARAGADIVVAWFKHPGEAESLGHEVTKLGRRFHSQYCDVTDETEVHALFAVTEERLGIIDVLVNNAGIQKSQPIIDMTVADFDQMLAVHLRGAFLCSREFARRLSLKSINETKTEDNANNNTATKNAQDRAIIKGYIINLCSQLGYIGRAEYTAYSTAKGGMIAFTRALAKELAPLGVLVNGVAPGLVDTGFDPLSEQAKIDHAASLPLGRLGTPEDMTSAFVFLASEDARYYCGQLLHPNGGEIMP